MRRLAIYLLGPCQVTLDGNPVTEFRSDKVRALLAYLAVEGGIPHRRDALAGLLWPDVPDSTARKNLRLSLHRLRDPLDDLEGDSNYFEITRETIGFKPAAATVDVATFTDLLATNRDHEHRHLTTCEACVERLEAAAELYRGDFLEGFFVDDSITFAEWMLVQRERLHRQALTVFYQLTDFHCQQGRLEQAQMYAWRQLELEPWREEAHRQLMDALARSGQICAALAQYETCRRALASELEIEPDRETESLYRRIRALRERPRQNLPPQATPFVGREKELASVVARLADPDCRLLTIVGPGGIGKSRLAIQAALVVADVQANRFLEGVTYVPLAGVESTEFMVPAIAKALDVSFYSSAAPAQQLITHLRQKEMLLVLDNFEHLLDGTDFLLELLEQAPLVKLLITSRERLGVTWEWLLPLDGMPYPQEKEGQRVLPEQSDAYDAVRLFQVSARRVQPDFELQGETDTAVIRICQTVGGMPLGVELAAAWVGVLPVTEIAAEIARRLDFPAVTARHLPARHRSLQAVFDHAWHQLSAVEQRVLAQCSVFRGGFTREAAAAVVSEESVNSEQSTVSSDQSLHCSLITDHCLRSLVDKSLLRLGAGDRYEMHGLLRQYAGHRLAASPSLETTARDRHGAYYAAFLQRRGAQLLGSDAAATLRAIETELANVHAAWRWAVKRTKLEQIECGVRGLAEFYASAGPFQQGTTLIEMAVDSVRVLVAREDGPRRDAQVVLSRLLAAQARLLNRQGMYDQASVTAQTAIDLARDMQDVDSEAASRLQWGIALHHKGQYETARHQLDRAVALARTAQTPPRARPRVQAAVLPEDQGDQLRQVEADSLRNLGAVFINQGGHARAKAYSEQALRIYREIGDRRGESGALNNLGAIAYGQTDYTEAKAYCERTLRIFREIGDRGDESTALGNLGLLSVEQGDYTGAQVYFEQALNVCRELGDRQSEGTALINLGLLFHRTGRHTSARGHYAQALDIYRTVGDRRSESLTLSCLGLLSHHLGADQAAHEYGQEAVDIAQDVGDPNVRAYALNRLGHALVGVGRLAEATELYQQALTLRRELGQSNLAMESLAGLARTSLAEGDLARALAQVNEILEHLDQHAHSGETGHGLDGTDEPYRIYWTCYRVLAACRGPRAASILRTAHERLQEQASKITDPALRRSFLENVPAHREILAEADKTQGQT